MQALDAFTQAYVVAALWSSTDNSNDAGGNPLDDNYGIKDIAPETLAQMAEDCVAFQTAHGGKLTEEFCKYTGCPAIEYAGHDFWLTRNGHGCGFWDGDWKEPVASQLTSAAKKFGTVHLYVGDDGKIHA